MDSTERNPSQKPKHRLFKLMAGWSGALIATVLLGLFGMLEVVAHRPSPVHATLTTAEINEEDAHLKQFGLIVPDGSLLKEHPFEPPWTSHSLLIPSSWSRQPGIKILLGSHHVRADLLLSDLDVLEPAMQRAYGGWDSAEARGWNWNQWFADWRKQLAAKGAAELPFDEAFAPIDALIAFQRDNHTQIPLNRQSTVAGSQTAVLASATRSPCAEIRASGQLFPIAFNDAGQQVRQAKVWKAGMTSFADTSYISMPSSYGTPQALRCGGTWIPLQPIGSAGGMRNVIPTLSQFLKRDQTRVDRLSNGIAYARLPNFIWSNYENVSRKDWAHRQPEDRVLIVDLRDNGGGDWNYGLETIKGWIDESRMVPFDDLGLRLNSSCLYAPLRWNRSVESTPTILPGQKAFLQDLLDRMAKSYPPGCPRTEDIKPPQWTYLRRRFAPKPGDLRIIALVNSRCGSDCELITAELASLPQTIVVGANTFGVFQFVQPGYSVLPHTGLAYRIALGRSNDYGDNRSVDGYGLDVDVVLPEVDSLTLEQLVGLAEIVAKL